MKMKIYLTERSTGTESVDSEASLTGLEQVASLFSFSKSALRSANRSRVCLKSMPRRGLEDCDCWACT